MGMPLGFFSLKWEDVLIWTRLALREMRAKATDFLVPFKLALDAGLTLGDILAFKPYSQVKILVKIFLFNSVE